MSRRAVVRVALAMIALGAGLMAQPGAVDAASLVKSSWWYRANTADADTVVPDAVAIPGGAPSAPAPLPATQPTVGEGSVLVEGTPEGATAVSALSWTLSDGELAPVLTIIPSDSSNVPADAVILACRAAVAWEAPEAQPGAWEQKPLVDCGLSVQGIPNPDGSIAFGLGPLVSGDVLDVVITPGLAQSQPVRIGSSFSLSFEPATGAVLATQMPAAEPVVVPDPATASLPSASAAPSAAYTPPAAYTPIAEPSLGPEEQAPALDQQAALPPTVTAAATDDDSAQGIGFLILLAGLAFGGLAYVTPARADDSTVGLGRFKRPAPSAVLTAVPAAPIQGGLGRFARPRTGPPPALS